MSSKQLDSILSTIPSATVAGEIQHINKQEMSHKFDEAKKTQLPQSKIVARIPTILKDEIRLYIKNNPGETEQTVMLKALQKMGFAVQAEWLVDRRSIR